MQEAVLALLESNTILAFVGAFGAGTLTALAPCSLISVPLLVGSSVAFNKDLKEESKAFYTYMFTFLFALGVALSFSIMGFIVAKFGGFFSIAPLWAYVVAGVLSFTLALYSFGIFKEFNKTGLITYFVKFKLLGALFIGLVFGLVSTPCSSAPLIAIVSVAATSGYMYAYALILAFAFGHSLLLLIAGISIGFAQSISSNVYIAKLSTFINRIFAMLLLGFAFYFLYQAYLQI